MMKRIEVFYGGHTYVIVDREISEVQDEVARILAASPSVGWIEARDGQSASGPVRLLVTPGVDIALIPLTPAADE